MDAIGVDKFTRGVSACVLTHAHTDHMAGLTRALESRQQMVHCSRDTLGLLAATGKPTRNLVAHPYYSWFRLTENTRCVFLESNHCIGGTMLLLEGAQTRERMLYTGDMRYEVPDEVPDRLRKYLRIGQSPARWCLDDTLVHHRALPDRRQMCDEVLRLVRNTRGLVHLRGELLGQEQITAALLEAGMPVHVKGAEPHARMRYYLEATRQGSLIRGLVADPADARVHVCKYQLWDHVYDLRVHLGVRWHSEVAKLDPDKHPVVKDPLDDRLVHVAFTSHASGNELRGFVRVLGLTDKRRIADTVKGCRTGIVRI